MKKRTAFIGAILSLIPLGQPLLIKTGVVLSSSAVIPSLSRRANAGDNSYYFDNAYDKAENGDYYGAISDYNKSIEINPEYSIAYNNRGFVKFKIKDYYGAISDYNKAIEINPVYALAYTNRSESKENIGDMKGACADAKKAFSLGDELSLIHI